MNNDLLKQCEVGNIVFYRTKDGDEKNAIVVSMPSIRYFDVGGDPAEGIVELNGHRMKEIIDMDAIDFSGKQITIGNYHGRDNELLEIVAKNMEKWLRDYF